MTIQPIRTQPEVARRQQAEARASERLQETFRKEELSGQTMATKANLALIVSVAIWLLIQIIPAAAIIDLCGPNLSFRWT